MCYCRNYIIIGLILLCGCAGYTKQDKQMIAAMWATSAVDYYQTNRILEDDKFNEQNGMIQDDTDAAVVLLGAPLALTVLGVFIPQEKRKYVFGAFIGVKGAAVIHNYEIGVR